jgi:hypothetical protein
MDDDTVSQWAANRGYRLWIFDHWEDSDIVEYIERIKYDYLMILGFSKGAETAYEVCRIADTSPVDLLLTVGTYHTVTSSFGNRRPSLHNVKKHYNMIEDFQQPDDFEDNPINIDLGNVTHWGSVKAALEKLDEIE